jgi:phospholipase C
MASIRSITLAALAVGTVFTGCGPAYAADDANFDQIETVVLIYAENRSFDNLYGHFPGANGLQNVSAEMAQQFDRDGTPLKELPPIWGGLTAKGVVPAVTQASAGLGMPVLGRRPSMIRTRCRPPTFSIITSRSTISPPWRLARRRVPSI